MMNSHYHDGTYQFYKQDLTLIPVWINNFIQYKVQGVITYPLPNFSSATVNIWELMRSTQTVRYTKIAHLAIPIEYDLNKQGYN